MSFLDCLGSDFVQRLERHFTQAPMIVQPVPELPDLHRFANAQPTGEYWKFASLRVEFG